MTQLKNRDFSLSATMRRLALAAAMSVLCTLAIANPPCPSDLDGDGEVGGGDMAIVLLDWGGCPVEQPVVSSVSPGAAPTSGGTLITIKGSALSGAWNVMVGNTPASGVTVVSDNTVTAITPPGIAGAANVSVTTAGGTATISGAFSYEIGSGWYSILEQAADPAIVTDSTLRARIAATGLPWRVRDKATAIEMVLIPPGTFMMGASPDDALAAVNEKPAHQVTLTKPYYVGRTEVTQAQWTLIMGWNFSEFSGDPSRPVENVDWAAIKSFCNKTGLRVTTEAEWEHACRAGTTAAYHGVLGSIGWYFDNSSNQTHPVSSKLGNGFGLYDMHGNVSEMCQDGYSDYGPAAVTDPIGIGSTNSRICRGGNWNWPASQCTSSARWIGPTGYGMNKFGFRVARTP